MSDSVITILMKESSYFSFSMGIESVVDERERKSSGFFQDAACQACEMAVVWMQSQLRLNQTQDRILNYINEVSLDLAI